MRIKNPKTITAVTWVVTQVLRVVYWTCKTSIIEKENSEHPYKETDDRRYLYCVWHDHAAMSSFISQPQNASALTSRHTDGTYIANLLRFRNIKAIRGSSNRGGALALRQLMKEAEKHHVVITPDGPQGPRRKIKHGILFLASHSGRTIIPTTFACSRYWLVKAKWTDMMVPKPFAKIICFAGTPISIPENVTEEQREYFEQEITSQMHQLEREAETKIFGKPLTESKLESDSIKELKSAA